jgi:hypothetical protein
MQVWSEIPETYILELNYPNPFNPVTSIKFGLPGAGLVTIDIYDLTGKVVEQLINGDLNAGT